MPRRAAIIPNRHIHTTLPPEIADRLALYLWSESEGKVPKQAYQTFFIQRIQEFFSSRTLDLSPYLGTLPGELVIQGNDHTLHSLVTFLQRGSTHDDDSVGKIEQPPQDVPLEGGIVG